MTKQPFIFNLDSYCLVSMSGDGAETFLQGQMTLNVEQLERDNAKLGAICNAKGRIISLFHIFRIEACFYLLMPQDIAQLTLDYLKTYSLFYKVTMTELNQPIILSNQTDKLKETAESDSFCGISIGQTAFVLAFDDLQQLQRLQTSDQVSQSQHFWYCQLAENKIPWLSQQTSGQFLPHNLNLPALKAVDFKKGCFTGQEIIARMQYKGKLKQELALLIGETDISSQIESLEGKITLLQADKKVGEAVCYHYCQEDGYKMLGLLKKPVNSLENFVLDLKNRPILKLKE